MAFDCPLLVGLVVEDCHLEMRAKNLGRSHSYWKPPEEALQKHLGRRSLDLRLAEAEKEVLVEEVEEVLVPSMDP
jgi:hypothetical protein